MKITFKHEDSGAIKKVSIECYLNDWEVGKTRHPRGDISFDEKNIAENIDLDLIITLSNFFNTLKEKAKCK